MIPKVLATFESGGAMWTACLERTPDGPCHVGARLLFVRDWIVGGTRRISCALDGDLAEVLERQSVEHVTRRLEEELRRMLPGPRAVNAGPVTSPTSTSHPAARSGAGKVSA